MTKRSVYIYAITMALTMHIGTFASYACDNGQPDSLKAERIDSISDSQTPRKRSLIGKIINYFNESNKPKQYKRFDFSIIGGPHFSSDTKLGLGLVAAGNYKADPNDTTTSVSNVSLYGDVSTVGFYLIGIRGNHFSKSDRYRVDYNVSFYSFPRKFWGIGYDAGLDYDNSTKFNEFYVRSYAQFMGQIGGGFYFGPGVDFAYANARKVTRPELWAGQKLHTSNFGLSLSAVYDTRDNLTAPQKGLYAAIQQRFFPHFLGNKYDFSSTTVDFSAYIVAWKDAVIAGHVHGAFGYGDVPWSMMPTFGGSSSMRGYYDGRFRDKCEADVTLEIRQHIWRRNGIVLWGGIGSVFARPRDFRLRHILPNGGIGYRWEFKKRTNVRLDYGIGKGESAFIFNINEAF
ncbi:MAG: outer membrane protein assembly factor [Muribaculaceae bacterium]|nr:outer membrane protein assembly factor [Muribaculaceae bacterium]